MDASSTSTEVTRLLAAAREGDAGAVDRLFQRAYEELRSLAHAVRRDSGNHTLNTTALVHEAYFKLKPSDGFKPESELHFKRIVGRAMRQVLIDAARIRTAKKRGGDDAVRVTLDDQVGTTNTDAVTFVQLETALNELEKVDQRAAEVVACRFFAGMDVNDTAKALGISAPTVKRDWRVARAWLANAMEP